MIAYRLYRNRPTLNCVARFAIGAELPAVKIGMAVRALLAHVGKYQFDMALRARHFFVHAPQRVARRVVFKFRNATDGLPTQRGMAVFAGNTKRGAVGIPSNGPLYSGTVLGADVRSKEPNLCSREKDGESHQCSEHRDTSLVTPGHLPTGSLQSSVAPRSK